MSRELPRDLYRQVVEGVRERAVLLSLCLTSRALYLEASRALYAKIDLEGYRQISAAFWTFNSASRFVELVNELTLRVGKDYITLPFLTGQIVNAINRMCNLTLLGLTYLWPLSSSDMATSAPWAPSNEEHCLAWTCNLKLPNINSLSLQTGISMPIGELFGELPFPLPRLETNRPLSVAYIGGVESVRCERLYGSREEPLVHLRALEVLTLDTYVDNMITPNLDTLVYLYPSFRDPQVASEPILWYLIRGCFDQLQRLGPVYGEDLQSIPDLSRITKLTSVVFYLPFAAFRDFTASDAHQLAQRNPKLRRIGVLSTPSRFNLSKRARLWESRCGAASPTKGDLKDSWRLLASLRVGLPEWEATICNLLYDVHPSKFLAKVVDIA